jgi:spermidine/putrescine transport system substrate-binding protein
MWVNVRCFNLKNMPVWGWFLTGLAAAFLVFFLIRKS